MTTFVESSNIEMLWNIIIKNHVFQKSTTTEENMKRLREYYINFVKTFVEKNVSNTQDTLMSMNKMFIADFIRSFQAQPQVQSQSIRQQNTMNVTPIQGITQSQSQSQSQSQIPQQTQSEFLPKKLSIDNNSNLDKNDVITIEEIKNVRMAEFESKYERMQNDFNQYRQNDAPKNVEFSEKKEEDIIGAEELENAVSEKQMMRNTQESQIIESAKTAMTNEETMKWLNLDKKENETKEETSKSADSVSVSIPIPISNQNETINLENKIVGSHITFDAALPIPIDMKENSTPLSEIRAPIPIYNAGGNELIASNNELTIQSIENNKKDTVITEYENRIMVLETQVKDLIGTIQSLNTKVNSMEESMNVSVDDISIS
jgi:hypothetical protein